jgi:hypothetical protein
VWVMGAAQYNAIVDAVIAVYLRPWKKVFGRYSSHRYVIVSSIVSRVVDGFFVKRRRALRVFEWKKMKSNRSRVLNLSKKVYAPKRLDERVEN